MPAVSRRWSLPGEYTTVFAIAWSGFYLGTAVNFPLGTALCQSGWGWPGVFYVAGARTPTVTSSFYFALFMNRMSCWYLHRVKPRRLVNCTINYYNVVMEH